MIKTDKPRAINFKIIDNVKKNIGQENSGRVRQAHNLYQQDLGMPQYIETKVSKEM